MSPPCRSMSFIKALGGDQVTALGDRDQAGCEVFRTPKWRAVVVVGIRRRYGWRGSHPRDLGRLIGCRWLSERCCSDPVLLVVIGDGDVIIWSKQSSRRDCETGCSIHVRILVS